MHKQLALVILLALASPVYASDWGEQVEIQGRIVSDGAPVSLAVDSQVFGTPGRGDYWNFNVPMPYHVPVDRWLCVTDATAEQWPDQHRPYLRFKHAHPDDNHDYHSLPWNRPMTMPMAFPPGHETALTFVNGTGTKQWVQVRIAGYLGRSNIETRVSHACLPE